MSNFVPKKEYLRGILLHYFFMKKTAAESHRILVEVYGEHALSETTCRDWFRHFKFKDGDFSVEDKERPGQPKKFEDEELIGGITRSRFVSNSRRTCRRLEC